MRAAECPECQHIGAGPPERIAIAIALPDEFRLFTAPISRPLLSLIFPLCRCVRRWSARLLPIGAFQIETHAADRETTTCGSVFCSLKARIGENVGPPCVLAAWAPATFRKAPLFVNVSLCAVPVTFMSMGLTQTKMDRDADLHILPEK